MAVTFRGNKVIGDLMITKYKNGLYNSISELTKMDIDLNNESNFEKSGSHFQLSREVICLKC